MVIDAILLGIVNTVVRALTDEATGLVLSFAVSFLYYGFFEGGPSGQTVGKKVLDIRVVRSIDGGPLGWGTALLRHLSSYLSALPFALGYLWMLWDREKQTWHDKLSATVVVPAPAWPPPPGSFGKPPGT
ncbi:MAG: RDD family protein [Actinomycetota bacterium]|nr:RDD family protein [Actinomycetota bacterium]